MMDKISIEGSEVIATSPEGKTSQMPLDVFLAKLAPKWMDLGGVIEPDGIKTVVSQGNVVIWVYECPPQLHRFLWIAEDSPAQFGKGTKYRTVKIALPYVVLLAVFASGPNGPLQLTSLNECFFRVAPLKSMDDELCYPALLNCSKFTPPDGRPLAWLCTQHLNFPALAREPDLNRRMNTSFEALKRCLFETGFNYSSERHEGASWFGESRGVDARISSIDKWQSASESDPLFVLEVPWLKTGYTLRQVTERVFKHTGACRSGFSSASALARVVFNHK